MVPSVALDSFHTAHLDPASGYGLVVCPRPEDDVCLDGASVLMAAWEHACAQLASLGWAPARDASGFLTCLGATADGSLVVEARSFRAPHRLPEATTWRELCAQVGLVSQVTEPRH